MATTTEFLLPDASLIGPQLSFPLDPEDFQHDKMGCSKLETDTSISPVHLREPRKRSRSADEEDDQILKELYSEVKRLRGVNHLLQESCTQIERKARAAQEQNENLQKLVACLQPHKALLAIHPTPASLTSSSGSTRTDTFELDAVVCEDPTEQYLALEHSPCKSQPVVSEFSMTPCKDDKRRVQSARPAEYLGGSSEKLSKLPSRLEDDPRTAATAAVVAAALAFNNGSPAAALVDLLQLAITRKQADAEVAY